MIKFIGNLKKESRSLVKNLIIKKEIRENGTLIFGCCLE